MSRTGGNQPTKEMPCADCGEPVVVNAQTVNPPRCYACGEAAHTRAVREMHEHRGPAWEKWLASNGSSDALRGNQNARKG